MGEKKRPETVKWTSSIDTRALVLLRRRSEKTGAAMSWILSRLILRAEKDGWVVE